MRKLRKLAKRSRGHEAASPAGSSPWLGLVRLTWSWSGKAAGRQIQRRHGPSFELRDRIVN